MKYDIYFHDDFDGFGGAAIMLSFLRSRGDDAGHLVPVNFDILPQWYKDDFFLKHKLFKGKKYPAIVIDFPFHPGAAFYFDHHPTSFKKAEWKKRFKQTKQWVFDAKYYSAGHLVYAALKKNFGWKPPARFKDFIYWLDIVDGARYKSAKQAIEMKEPALQINRVMEKDHPSLKVKELVDLLAEKPLKEIARVPQMKKDIAWVLEEKKEGIKFTRENLKRFGDKIAYIFYPSRSVPKLRYAPFYLYPKIRYVIRLSKGEHEYHLGVGVNPWRRKENKFHFGKVMFKYGGGGHEGVGAAEFKTKMAADKATKELIELLTTKG